MAARQSRSDKEHRKRLEIVQRTMEEFGWSPRIRRKLEDKWGCSDRTIYEYRKQVLTEMAEGYDHVDFAERRAEFLDRLHMHQRSALKAGRFGPLSGMMGIEARVIGVDKPVLEAEMDDVPLPTAQQLADQITPEMLDEAIQIQVTRPAETRH